LFSHISMNWRGRPLVSHEVILELIAATRTRSGLWVQAELDQGSYPLGVKVSDRELAAVPLGGTTGTGSGTTPCFLPPPNHTGNQPCRAGTPYRPERSCQNRSGGLLHGAR